MLSSEDEGEKGNEAKIGIKSFLERMGMRQMSLLERTGMPFKRILNFEKYRCDSLGFLASSQWTQQVLPPTNSSLVPIMCESSHMTAVQKFVHEQSDFMLATLMDLGHLQPSLLRLACTHCIIQSRGKTHKVLIQRRQQERGDVNLW